MNLEAIASQVAAQLIALREKKGKIAMEDLSGILSNVANMLSDETSLMESYLRDEIMKIANHIEATKNEIIALVPDAAPEKGINSTTLQLDAIVKSTEEAAHTIMDAADQIQDVVNSSNATDEVKEKIATITASIYEACNFQDLTGQRIGKIMQALAFTESRIQKLIGLFKMDGTLNVEEFEKVREDSRPDAHLLNGPQLPGNAPTQADIDALFGN